MVKAIKWILIIGAGGIGFVVIVVISLTFIIDPNDYKAYISSMVEAKTGRSVAIPGDISLQISPKLDIVFALGEVRIGPGKGFPDTDFASAELVKINLSLLPLLTKRQLQVNNIDLQGVHLNLIRKKDGTTNWADLGGAAVVAEQAPVGQPLQPQKPLLTAIDIGGINIKDINVEFDDQQTGKTMSLSKFNLNTGHVQEGVAFPVSTDFKFRLDDHKQPFGATISTDFNLTLNSGRQHFIINGLTLDGLLTGDMLPASELAFVVLAEAEINLRDEDITVHKFTVQQGALQVETAFSLSGFKTPVIQGTLTVPEYSPREHLDQLGVALPRFSDPEVFERLSVALGFDLNNEQLQIKDIRIQFDDTAIKANALVNNFKKPVYVVQLHMDQLDLDRYAVHREEEALIDESLAKPDAEQTISGDQPLIPVQLLKALRFNADINIDLLTVAQLNMSELSLQADGKDGLVHLKPFSAKLYDGSIMVNGKIDVRPAVPVVNLNKTLDGVQLGPMFVDMTGREEFSGRADINVNVETRGLSRNDLVKNSNGTVKLSLEDGIIKRLQILETIRSAKALLDKQVVRQVAVSQPTGFASLTASGRLVNGIFKNDDLQAASELMKVSGKGQVDFVREHIDYLLTIYLTDRVDRDQKTGLVEFSNLAIPYRVRGSFTDLQQSAALEELFKAKAKKFLLDSIKKKIDPGADRKEQQDSGVEALIDRGLRGLFGN